MDILLNWGDGDLFKLVCKASSIEEGWMKSTKAMQIGDAGCLVQVTTQQGDNVAEALTFVPSVGIAERRDENDKVVSRKLTPIVSSKLTRTVGLYNEGKTSPRIEYRIMKGDKDITDNYDLFEQLGNLLKTLT